MKLAVAEFFENAMSFRSLYLAILIVFVIIRPVDIGRGDGFL